jgi:hypothetical protein
LIQFTNKYSRIIKLFFAMKPRQHSTWQVQVN